MVSRLCGLGKKQARLNCEILGNHFYFSIWCVKIDLVRFFYLGLLPFLKLEKRPTAPLDSYLEKLNRFNLL